MKFRIVILPKSDVAEELEQYSQSLGVISEGYRLDTNHAAHITIVAFEAEDISGANILWAKVKPLLIQSVQCAIEEVSLEEGGYVFAHLESSESFKALQKAVRDVLEEDITPQGFDVYAERPLHITLAVEKERTLAIDQLDLKEITFDRLALTKSGEFGSIDGPLSAIYLA